MKNDKIAARYANSLVLRAEELNHTELVLEDIKLVLLLLNQNQEFNAMMCNPVYQGHEKAALIESVFKPALSVLAYQFLQTVVTNGRAAYLRDILEKYVAIQNKKTGKISGKLITPSKTGMADSIAIKDKLEQSLQTRVELEYIENPDILGGFILQIEDKLYDASIKGKLRRIKSLLISEN